MTNAARARYPVPSSIEIRKNSRQIWGRKITVPPMPAMTPSTSSDWIAPSGMTDATSPPRCVKSASIQSIGYAASLKIDQNNAVMTTTNAPTPSSGCVKARSRRSVSLSDATNARSEAWADATAA